MPLASPAEAGVDQPNDIVVRLAPAEPGKGIRITLVSPVAARFGRAIEAAIRDTLLAHGVADALVEAQDQGALDYAVRARVLAALFQAGVCVSARRVRP